MKYFSLFPTFGLEIVRTGKSALPGIPLRHPRKFDTLKSEKS